MSEKTQGYRDTLNLPKTRFAMKANLIQNEPQIRKRWATTDLYAQIREARKGAPLYILHDGPPYANGNIHMGHVINKVLKDLVVKYKTMAGFDAPYVPGWDCHGLPIESRVMTDLGEQAKGMKKEEIRKHCMKYASKYVKLQTKQFQSLGVFGDFANPYLTFKPSYEEGILEVFAELVDKGLVYKQLNPFTGRSAARRPWPRRSWSTMTSRHPVSSSISRPRKPPWPVSSNWASSSRGRTPGSAS